MSTQGHEESAIIIWRTESNKTLWQLRDLDESVFFGSHWGFFGGGIQGQESPNVAAIRELKEETGLSAPIIWDLGDFFHPQLSLLHCFLIESEIDLNQIQLGEGADFGLFSDDDVLSGQLHSQKLGKSFPIVPSLVDLFQKVIDNQFLRFGPNVINLPDTAP